MALDLHFNQYGSDGPPVVITHGLFGAEANWTPIAKRLAETHRIFTVDMRNHGHSPWGDEMSYEVMAEDIAHFIETHKLGPTTVIGHSMGGKAAMTMALSAPKHIERLAIVDIAPVAYDHNFDKELAVMNALPLATFTRRSEAQTALQEEIGDPLLAGFFARNLKHSEHDGFEWRVNLEAIGAHIEDIVSFPVFEADQAFEAPTLFLAGSNSDYIRSYHHGEIERLFPNAEIEFIDNAGHWVHAEQPEAVIERLGAFLRG